jgi:glycosyltransferase involved in cell wall biosynthesis
MKVLLIHPLGPAYATFRARLELYLPALRARGLECHVTSLLRDGAVRHLGSLTRIREYDLVVVYHRISPLLPAALERRILDSGVPYIYDFDDAVYLEERLLTRGKTSALISGASAVIAGSSELARYARTFNRSISIIPTVVDLARFPEPEAPRSQARPLTIGWMGAPATTHYLQSIAAPLRRLTASRAIRFVTVGASPLALPGVRIEQRPWALETEIEELMGFDVGIMPLTDDEWSRGKCGYKLVQYMAAGIPSVASPVGANREIVDDGVTGFLADTPEQWVSAFERLADDRELRARMGAAARARCEAHFSLGRTAPELVRVFAEAAGSVATPSGIVTA